MTRVWRCRLAAVCFGALAVSLAMPEDAFAGRRRGHGSFGSSGGFGGSSGGFGGGSGGFIGGGSFGSVGGGSHGSHGSKGGLFGRRRGKRARGFGSSGGGFGSSGGGFGSSGGGWGSSGGGWGSSGGGWGSSGGGMYVPHGGDVGPAGDVGPDGPPPPPPQEARRYYNQPRPANQVATIEVKVPANAKVYLQDQAMSLTGPVRRFVSPELEAGRSYRYNVRVEVEHNGETISKTAQADVRAGQRVEVAVAFAEDKTDKLVSNVRLASSSR